MQIYVYFSFFKYTIDYIIQSVTLFIHFTRITLNIVSYTYDNKRESHKTIWIYQALYRVVTEKKH